MSLSGYNQNVDIYELLLNQYFQNTNSGATTSTIYNQNTNLGTTTSNLYNLQKLNYRSSATLVGSNLNIDANDIYHTLSNSNGDVYNFDYGATSLQLSITSSSNADQLGSTGINTVLIRSNIRINHINWYNSKMIN